MRTPFHITDSTKTLAVSLTGYAASKYGLAGREN